MHHRPIKRRGNWHVFRWPIAIALISIAGLLSALVGDAAYDVFSWLALGGVVILMILAYRR